MNDEMEKFWRIISPGLRRQMGFGPLNDDELSKLLRSVEPSPLPDDKLEKMVDAIVAGKPIGRKEAPKIIPMAFNDAEAEEITDEAMALCRNEGENDPEMNEYLEKLRREALGEEESTDAGTKIDRKNGERPSSEESR